MADRPRVLLHAFSTFNLGGPQARFVQLANDFGSTYHHVIAAMDNCFVAGDRLGPQVSWNPLHLDIKRGGALGNRSSFRSVLKELRPDLLLSYNWGAIEWAAANTPELAPHLHVEDGFGPEESTGQLPRRVWMRRVLLAARGVHTVVASRNLERIAVQKWWMRQSRVKFIPNGVSVSGLQEQSIKANRLLTIGTVAGLRKEKNIARLINAFALVRRRYPARLIIVGDGPERHNLELLASELGIATDIEFVGYLKSPIERLQTFDLFALSSDTEQLPISLLEAMACGIPIVATRVGDVPDIIPEEARDCISEPKDQSFGETLLHVIESRNLWPIWIAAGQIKVRNNFSSENMIKSWQWIFEGDLAKAFSRPLLESLSE